jgi:hypothetical protein
MKSNTSWRVRLNGILVGAAIVIALIVVRGAAAGDEPVQEHLVTDWSHRHMIYSNPKSLMRRFELSQHHRYVQQWRRRESERRGDRNEWRWHRAPEPATQFQGDWSMDMGAGATVGAGNYPAKFSFATTSANCATPAPPVGQQPDFVVYNTSLVGSASQATIVAFDNLYSSCTGGTPLTYWAYNTGLPGAALTSPVLSNDGTQVAFIQSGVNGTSAATLVVLRWKANNGTLSAPVTPSAGACTALTAPCQQTVTFSTANGDANPWDSFSSPFYDYPTDTLYVGDNAGFLHKFTPVFFGTPTEVVSSGATIWPSPLDAFGHLSSPVYVDTVHQVLVTDSNGDIYSVDSVTGGDCFNPCNAGANFLDPKLASPGFDDGPIVDVTTGRVYVFARASSEFFPPITTGAPSGAPSVFVLDIPANPAAIHLAPVTQIIVSDAISPAPATIPATPFYIGAFNNQYYITGGTGYLYVCGTAGTLNALWQIHVDGSTVDAPFLGPTLTTANTGCSPITEFFNGTTDRMFLSVTGSAKTAAPIACPASPTGCVMSFSTDPVAFAPGIAPLARTSATGGSSGIVIDNSSAAGGASQVYFTPLGDQTCTTSGGTGGCAIQASQAGLL